MNPYTPVHEFVDSLARQRKQKKTIKRMRQVALNYTSYLDHVYNIGRTVFTRDALTHYLNFMHYKAVIMRDNPPWKETKKKLQIILLFIDFIQDGCPVLNKEREEKVRALIIAAYERETHERPKPSANDILHMAVKAQFERFEEQKKRGMTEEEKRREEEVNEIISRKYVRPEEVTA